MKKLICLGTIFLSLTSFSQNFTAENPEHNKILYRGYENKLTLDQIGCDIDNYQLEPVNCELSLLDPNGNKNTYIIKPKSSAKTAKIRFVSKGQVLDSILFIVQNLPSPSLYWGNHKSGASFSSSPEIELKYSAGVTLKSTFEIVNWKYQKNDTVFMGSGNLLSSEFLAFTESIVKGESISIEIEVRNADGTVRKRIGSWIKE